ncbi:TnsA endonuclease N-terminal domain-containing protein [Methylacidimicrobium tartarophylax]|uniref:TnsA endonuclease N-terminal domain-containing protein n=1 Tax=Methylacidimicrobium tartarophylax TaxID=1041768 RepID=A0A5E6MHC8_9BACT|nr:TnsA endonuclease N-terminal domain-containing protein [Methylacidimicrobium tartarophylax]VVM07713.1 hypothetical protein MAMT_01876 [Methylacidimicrobium tartarophylax]
MQRNPKMDSNGCNAVRPVQARRIGPARRSVAGIYAFRGKKAIPYESTLERDFLIRCEFSLAVVDAIPQPVQIPFVSGGRSYVYTPDFLIYYQCVGQISPGGPRPSLIEVKPEGEWRKHWRRWLPKWKAAYRYARGQGWEFRIHDESRIRDQTLRNIRFLERYKRMRFPPKESCLVLEGVREAGGAAFRDVLARQFPRLSRVEGAARIWHLLATRQLDCDIGRPLGDFTELWVPGDE